MNSFLKFFILPVFAFQLVATVAFAAEKLQVDLVPQGARARNQSPIPVEARFKWDSTRILEGQLEMEFREGNRVLGRYRSGDLALTGGDQSFRMLLPAALVPFSDAQMEVQMKFLTAGNSIELDPSILSVPTASERSLVVAWCDVGTTAAQPASDLVQNLRLEHFAAPADTVAQRLLMTSLARITPEDLPAQPLAYTSYDLVVLTAEAFKAASERQLQALARWVRGGGSLCVFVGAGIQPPQLHFLNQLAESNSEGPEFLSDGAGNLLPVLSDILCLHSGLGRSVIVAAKTGATANANTTTWRKAAIFLWKVRSEWMQTIPETPPKEPATDEITNAAPMALTEYASRFPSFQPTNRGAMMLANRKPMTVEVMDGILALTDDERPKLKAALDEWSNAVKQLRTAPPAERRNKVLAARQTLQTNVQTILTPEQLKKFQGAYPRVFAASPSPRPQILNNRNPLMVTSYGTQPSILANELLSLLMPHTVRLIPFSALLGMLLVFLIVIGPADYFVLGFLRRRRLTWLLFPATSIAFTVATVMMANHYLGLRDQRRSLTVVDLAEDGTALRWNRYELVFAARDKQAVTQLKDTLWSPLDVSAMPAEFYNPSTRTYVRGYGYGYGNGFRPNSELDASPPLYAGTLPVHYQTSEAIRQWRPELNRFFSFEPPPVPLIPNWPAIEAAWPNLPAMRARLAETKSFQGDFWTFSRFRSPADQTAGTSILSPAILETLCLGEADGLMSIVSQISPNGGSNFEDVSGIDREADDSVLALVAQVGEDIVVYRRFFYGN